MLLLGHGAGGDVEAPDLLVVAAATLELGMIVVRVEQPYRVAGRRAPAPAARLDEAWHAAVVGARTDASLAAVPLVAGGRSSGARVACRTAEVVGAVGVLALAFPLHPPSSPHRTRLPELAGAGVPALVVQGERDAFGGPDELRDQLSEAGAPSAIEVLGVPGDHSLARGLEPALPRIRQWLTTCLATRRE